MMKKFKMIDEKNTGHISVKDFRMSMQSCALLTPKEINVIIRGIKEEQKTIEYKTFDFLLFEVRFELAKSRLMDTGLGKLTDNLIDEFGKYDLN